MKILNNQFVDSSLDTRDRTHICSATFPHQTHRGEVPHTESPPMLLYEQSSIQSLYYRLHFTQYTHAEYPEGADIGIINMMFETSTAIPLI